MADEQGAIPEALVLAGYVRGIATVIRAFPNDCAWGGPDQAEHAAATLDQAYAVLATPASDRLTDTGEVERCRALVEAVKAGRFDALDAAADQWSETAGVQRMSNAIASVFEKYASQEIMDRFREKITALMHLAFVEGAGQGVMQVAALATPKPSVDAEAMKERCAKVADVSEARLAEMWNKTYALREMLRVQLEPGSENLRPEYEAANELHYMVGGRTNVAAAIRNLPDAGEPL